MQPILFKDSANREKCKIKVRETNFYFHTQPRGIYINMCNAPFTTDFQKAAFRPAKAYLLEAERLPFTSRKATFWKTAAALTYELMATPRPHDRHTPIQPAPDRRNEARRAALKLFNNIIRHAFTKNINFANTFHAGQRPERWQCASIRNQRTQNSGRWDEHG